MRQETYRRKTMICAKTAGSRLLGNIGGPGHPTRMIGTLMSPTTRVRPTARQQELTNMQMIAK
jgi:hypothetical protein